MWINKTKKRFTHVARKCILELSRGVVPHNAPIILSSHVWTCMHATYIRIKTHLRKYKSCQALQSGIIRYKILPLFLLLLRFLKVCKRRQDKKPSQKKECEALDLIEHVCLSANCTYISLHCVYMVDQRYNHLYFVFFLPVALLFTHTVPVHGLLYAQKSNNNDRTRSIFFSYIFLVLFCCCSVKCSSGECNSELEWRKKVPDDMMIIRNAPHHTAIGKTGTL